MLRRNIAEIASYPLSRGQIPDPTGSIGSTATATAGINVRRIVKWAVFVIATSYFIVDAIFLTIATPLARWMARQRIFIRSRKWITSLRPYPSLALFAVPLIILEPVKPIAAYLIATGQITAGMTVLGVGEILKLIIIERLFKLCRRKLLKIPLFARGYGHWRQGVDWIVSTPAWQAVRRQILLFKLRLRNFLVRLKRSSNYRRHFIQSRWQPQRVSEKRGDHDCKAGWSDSSRRRDLA